MGSSHRRPSLLAALCLVALAACADPSAPAADAAAQVLAGKGKGTTKQIMVDSAKMYVASGTVLQRATYLKSDFGSSTCLAPDKEAWLSTGPAGLYVYFPVGSVSVTTCVTVTAYHGGDVVYEFGPHGTQFNVPISLYQDLHATNAAGNLALLTDLFGGYVPAGEADISADGTVQVSEVFPVELIPYDGENARFALFKTTHFSGYVLATGRTSY